MKAINLFLLAMMLTVPTVRNKLKTDVDSVVIEDDARDYDDDEDSLIEYENKSEGYSSD